MLIFKIWAGVSVIPRLWTYLTARELVEVEPAVPLAVQLVTPVPTVVLRGNSKHVQDAVR